MVELADTQIERWRILREVAHSDSEWLEYHKQRDSKRLVARREMLELLDRYLREEINTEQFRSVFDHRTRSDWDVFGLKGLSGAMLLNIFVKHIPNQDTLTDHLRTVLPAPESPHSGREKMSAFLRFVEDLISSGEVLRQQIQPARIPFFVSAWWHMQDTEQWPVFYVSARNALETEGLYAPAQDLLERYFAFRDTFLALASALGTDSWELEHLCTRYETGDEDTVKTPPEAGPGAKPLFSAETFDLLAGLHKDPTKAYYQEHREGIRNHVEEPFRRLVREVARRLPAPIAGLMEMEKGVFARILKNDYGRGGAWPFYWGTFYPKGGKRIQDVQLSTVINKDLLEFGFYIGAYGSEQRGRFLENCRRYRTELVDLIGPMTFREWMERHVLGTEDYAEYIESIMEEEVIRR